mmetsp:Transcript_54645/g.176666  ORF Transcript_54645/g.176666 Transcript_54645/m.176666 type:complete len:200 (+) Transcript_54645:165-764(+)
MLPNVLLIVHLHDKPVTWVAMTKCTPALIRRPHVDEGALLPIAACGSQPSKVCSEGLGGRRGLSLSVGAFALLVLVVVLAAALGFLLAMCGALLALRATKPQRPLLPPLLLVGSCREGIAMDEAIQLVVVVAVPDESDLLGMLPSATSAIAKVSGSARTSSPASPRSPPTTPMPPAAARRSKRASSSDTPSSSSQRPSR